MVIIMDKEKKQKLKWFALGFVSSIFIEVILVFMIMFLTFG